MPPPEFIDPLNVRMVPAPEVTRWARTNILADDGQLHNPDHIHLTEASIEFLWAPCGFAKQGRVILGQCEELTFRCGPWQKWRQQQQMTDWFGHLPDFLITLDASHCMKCTDVEFCALLEHELFHIGHQTDDYGAPAFTKDGRPKLGMRGHDVEEFVGVVRRYGASEDVQRLIDAAKTAPEVGKLNIARACGTCLLRVA
ncbi:MAG: putative metallopeptidase [Pseudomonadota bacterium]